MGQTLTHGIYLPDEGERNCYAGLAANWQLLDGAVGTVAEHTTQIAGKAPLVHTHTKADVTDLLNSNFIPSANNSYDLGSSSYQWKSMYAQSYYYNGVAWGLDKVNTWSKTQNFVGEYQGTEFSYNYYTCFAMYGRNDTVGKSGMFFTKYRPNKAQGSLVSSDIIQYGVDILENEVRTQNAFLLQVSGYDSNTNKFTKLDIVSGLSNANLGNLTNKWKSLNGVNPGALSLPNYDDTTYIDISGSIVPPSGETEINKNLGNNEYTPPVDGWLSIRCDGATFLQIYRNAYNCPGVTSCDPSGAKLVVTLPVCKNVTYTIRIKTSGTTNLFQLYPCRGNV